MADGSQNILTDEEIRAASERLRAQDEERRSYRQQSWDMTQPPPDQAAEALKLGGKFGVPRQAIEADPEMWRQRDAEAQRRLMMNASPKTMAWLDDEDNYAVGKDDVENLTAMESLAKSGNTAIKFFLGIPDAAKAAGPGWKAQAQGFALSEVNQSGTYLQELEAFNKRQAGRTFEIDVGGIKINALPFLDAVSAERGPDPGLQGKLLGLGRYGNAYDRAIGGYVDRAGAPAERYLRAAIDKSLAEQKALAPKSGDFVADSLLSGVTSLVNMVPSFVVAGITKNPSLAASMMGGQVYGQEYGAGILDYDMTESDAKRRALLQSAIEIGTERISLGIVLDQFASKGKSVASRFLVGMGTEQVQEQFATLGQDFVDWQMLYPDKTFEQFLEERPERAAQTALATLVAAGGMQATLYGVDASVRALTKDAMDVRPSAADKAVSDMLDKAGSSKLRTRAPEKFSEAISKQTEGTALETVAIDLDGLAQSLEAAGLDITETLTELGVPADAISETAIMMGTVEVPTSRLLASEAAINHRDKIQPHIRLVGESLTPAQKETVGNEVAKQAARISDEIRETVDKDAAFASQIADIEEATYTALQASENAYNPRPGEYRAQARIHALSAAYAAKRSAEEAGTPIDLPGWYAKNGLKFGGQNAAPVDDAAVLKQAQDEGYTGTDAGEARQWAEAVAKGLDMGVEARNARADEMLGPGPTLYHWTETPEDNLYPFTHVGTAKAARDRFINPANGQRSAGELAERRKNPPAEGATYPVRINLKNVLDIGEDTGSHNPIALAASIAKVTDNERLVQDVYDAVMARVDESDLMEIGRVTGHDWLLNEEEFGPDRDPEIIVEAIWRDYEDRLSDPDQGVDYMPEIERVLLSEESRDGRFALDAGFDVIASFLEREGITALSYQNAVEDAGSISYIVPNPSNIRSTNAAFDPDASASSDLLAQSIRTAASMPIEQVTGWVRDNISANIQTFPNGDESTVITFPLTEDPDAPPVMISFRLNAKGRADVNLFLDNKMADALDGVESVTERARLAKTMFGKAVLVMRQYALENDVSAFAFIAAESEAEGTNPKSREALYRYMLSTLTMEGYTAYELESMTSVVSEADGVKSANPLFPSAGFVLVKDGVDANEFAKNEILRGNQRGGNAGEVVTALTAKRLGRTDSGNDGGRGRGEAGAADTGRGDLAQALNEPGVQEALSDPETDILHLTDEVDILQLDQFLAFHGTLNKFDKFETKKIGSGEGAQAFGPGHYFTQSRGVAEWYRKRMKQLAPGLRMGKEEFNKANPAHFAMAEYWKYRDKNLYFDLFGGFKSAASNRGHADAISAAIWSLEHEMLQITNPMTFTGGGPRTYASPDRAVIRDSRELVDFLKAGIAYLKTLNPDSSKGIPRPSKRALRGGGNVYSVAIKMPPEVTIQYDLTLGEQPEKVKAAFMEAAEAGALGDAKALLDKYGDGTRMSALVGALKASDSPAMKIMRANGIRGVRYLDGFSRGKRNKAGQTYNYVAFNDEDVTILDRKGYLFQALDQEKRGSYSPMTRQMNFGAARDPSTFMHESAHWFLDMLEKLSATEAWAAEDLRQIDGWYQSIRSSDQMKEIRARYSVVEAGGGFQVMYQGQAMGRPMASAEEAAAAIEWRERQEAFAETFEQYLMTGKAPVPSLVKVFRAFKDWLVSLYRGLMPGERANLNPEIRDFFDRVLAVDAEVDAASAETFRDAETMAKDMLEKGIITERQYRMVGERLNEAREKVKEEMTARVMDEKMREQTDWWEKEKARVKGELARVFDKSPVGRAFNWLAYGEWKGDLPETEKVDSPDAVFQFAGVKAKGADTRSKQIAERMRINGVDPKTIWAQTGWRLDLDGNWKWEIDDSAMTLAIDPAKLKAGARGQLRLLINHPELFRNYPELAGINVEITDQLPADVFGSYNSILRRMQISLAALQQPEIEVRRMISHEIQHAIQGIEGFSLGANPDFISPFYFAAEVVQKEAIRDRLASEIRLAMAEGRLAMAQDMRDQMAILEGDIERTARYAAYDRVLGEVEARMTEVRMGLNAGERRGLYPEPDVPINEITIRLYGTSPQAPKTAVQWGRIVEPMLENSAGGELFQEAPAEPRTLFVAHNTSEEKLRKTLELGGFPMPSLAVARTDKGGFPSFGEITFLADPRILDEKDVTAYDADIYSPTVPEKFPKVSPEKAGAFVKKAKAHIPEGAMIPDYLGYDETDRELPRTLMHSELVQLAYLAEQGRAPKLKKLKVAKEVKAALKTEYESPERAALALAYYTRLDQELNAARAEKGIEPTNIWVEDDGTLSYRNQRNFDDLIAEAKRSPFDQKAYKSELYNRTMGSLAAREKFAKYTAELASEITESYRIFKGFTYSGNRKWVPFNLENVMAEMRKDLREGNHDSFGGTGSIRARVGTTAMPKMKDVQRNRDRIFSEDEMQEIKDRQAERFMTLADEIARYYKFAATGLQYYDAAAEAIALGPKEWRENFTEEALPAIRSYVEELKALPTEYFEAKANRVMQIGDFAVAVVPRNVSPDIKQALQDAGVTIRYYKKGDEADRLRAISQQDDMLFQGSRTYNPPGHGAVPPPADLPPIRLDLRIIREQYGADAVKKLPAAVRRRSSTSSNVSDMMEIIETTRKALARKKRPKSLFEFIRSRKVRAKTGQTADVKQWGIKGAADELRAMDRADLINEGSGIPIDTMRELADEAGYIGGENGNQESTINDLLNAIDKEARGEKVYSSQDRAELEAIQTAEVWAKWFEDNGIDIYEKDKKAVKAKVEAALAGADESLVSPDQAAELLGFETGEELLAALAEVGNREKYLNDQTEKQMAAEFGDMMNDGTLQDEAREAARLDIAFRQTEVEMEALARAVGVQASSNYAKQLARDIIGLRTVKEIAAYERDLDNERRFGKAAMRAVEKGDYAEALKLKQRQLVAMHLYKEGKKAHEKIEKTRKDLLKYYSSEGRRDKIANDYLDRIVAILDDYELRVSKQGPKEQQSRQSAAAYVAWMTEQGREAEIAPEAMLLAAQASLKTWRGLTGTEVEYLAGTIQNLAHLGRTKQRLLNDKEKREREAILDDLTAALDAAPSGKTNRQQSFTKTPLEGAATWLRKAHARLTRMEFQFNRLDGQENGALNNALWQPFADAADTETARMRDAAVEMQRLYAIFDTGERRALFHRRIATPELRAPGKGLTLMDAVVIGLNWGNEGNRQAIIDGYADLGWTADAVEAMLNRVLTDKHWDFIEGVWDLIGTYREDAFALEKDITGVAPKAVEGVTFKLASGRTIKGQYYPLKYANDLARSDSVKQARLDEKQMLSEMGKSFSKPMTRHGHLIERVGSGGKPVKLSIGVFHEHVASVIHDIAYRRAIIDVYKLISSPRFADAYIQAAGREQYDMLIPWVAQIANERKDEPGGYVTDLLRGARRNFSIMAMGFKFGTAIQQMTGPIQGIPLIGTRYAAQGFFKALAGGPASFWSAWQWVSQKSEFMRDRPMGFDRDVREVTNKIQERSPLGAVRRNAFIMIGVMDTAVSTAVWIGAYDKAMDGKMKGVDRGDEEAAIAAADSIVRRSQVAGRMQDLPQMMRGTELEKLMTVVYSYFSGLYNETAQEVLKVRGGQLNPVAFTANMTLLYVVVPLMASLLAGRLIPDDDDEPEDMAVKVGKELASNAVSTVPFVRDVLNATMNPQFGYQLSPAGSIIEGGTKAASNLATGEGFGSEYATKQTLNLMGLLFGLPTGQMFITGEYLYGVATGEEDPTEDPVDAAREALLRDTR